jgi:hypothetical protein
LSRKGKIPENRSTCASISVTAEREDQPPRISQIRYVLRIKTDEPAQRVNLLRRNLERFGTIFNTLAAACPVSGEIVVDPGTSPSPAAVADVVDLRGAGLPGRKP